MPDAPSTLDLPNPFPDAEGVLRLLEPADADHAALVAQVLNGTYAKPFLAESGDTRALHFSWTYVQSRMRISAPTTLAMAYTRTMMSVLLLHPNPARLLLLGLGGGSLAKFCRHHLPRATIVVVERSPHVLGFREQFAVPPDDERFRVVADDAAVFVAGCRDRHDVILIDAYDRDGLSEALGSREFYAAARARLLPGGVLVANLAGTRAERAAHLATVRSVFGDDTLVVPVEEDDDDIVFAFETPAFEPRWRWMEGQAEPMQRRYGLDFPRLAASLKQSARLDGAGSSF